MSRPLRFLSSAPPEQQETIHVESDFVVIIAALLCALICVVGLAAVARCAWLRRSSAGGSSTAHISNKGLKKKVLQSLPKSTFDSTTSNLAAEDCAICLAEFVDGDEIRVLPPCSHPFHVGCVDTWLGSHSSCPSCRQLLVATRCQKCGHFPPQIEAARKAREDNANANANGFLP